MVYYHYQKPNPEKYETVQIAKKVSHIDDTTLGVVGTQNLSKDMKQIMVGLFNDSFITLG